MSLFRRDAPDDSRSQTSSSSSHPERSQAYGGSGGASAARPAAQRTHIAPGTVIDGEITGSTDLVVDGKVQGTLRLDSQVTVGESGQVSGRIEARSVRVAGQVQGDVTGSERVEVTASGSLEGDISAPRVTIAEGAFFKGQVEMRTDGRRGGDQRARQAEKKGGQGAGAGEAGERAVAQPGAGGRSDRNE